MKQVERTVVWQVEKLRKYGFMVRDIAWDSPFLGLAAVCLLGISFFPFESNH
jgi:hypothetical protein